MTMSQGLKVSRSRWMLLASGLLATSSPCDLPAQQGDVMKMTIAPVAPGIHVISGFANGNILVIEGPMDLLLVDAQSMKRVALFEYSERAAADKKAQDLTTSQKTPHFVQPVKEAISDRATRSVPGPRPSIG